MTELPEQIESQLSSFGVRLRELRRQRGWTLQELACRGGFSKAFLSRLESGDRQASIAAVLTLARIFGVSISSLFEPELAADPCVIVRGAEAAEGSINGLKYVMLSNAGRFFNLQPIKVTVPLSRKGNEHYHHEGEEWIYVLSGALTLSLAGKTHDLVPGDAAHFDSRLPHRLIATGRADAEVLVVASPVTSPEPAVRIAVRQHRAIPGFGRLRFPAPDETTGFGRLRRAKSFFQKQTKNKQIERPRYE
jgi:transcriptional regulator with XRE-family HTH domain